MTPDETKQATFLVAGIPVYSDPNCLSIKEFRDVPRTWKERLFTRPWRPLRKTRREGIPVSYMMDLPAITVMGIPTPRVRRVVAHPEIVEQLRKRFPND